MKIPKLQELFGYLLTADTRQQKIFLLVGPKQGTIARVIRGLVGANNIAAPTLSSLATNFGLAPLIAKSVAIISDARLSGRPDQGVIVERLLSISGEDAQTIDRKHQTAITCKLPTRFVILSNELPRLHDASGAVISRMILLHTTRSFYGSEDHGLTEKLLAELPGILLWSIQGWQRLRQRVRFIQPDSALESLSEMNDLTSPRDFPKPCPWCGGRTRHNPRCDELRASWEISLPFGKHKGKPLSRVPLSYLEWLTLKSDSLDGELREAISVRLNGNTNWRQSQ